LGASALWGIKRPREQLEIDMTLVKALAVPAPATVKLVHPAPRQQRKVTWLVVSIATAGSLAGLAVILWRVIPGAPVHYVTEPAALGPIVRTVTASGTVNPVITVQVGTYVSGVVQERFCDYNTEVKKDQLCAKIDPRLYEPVVEQGAANLAVAKAQLEKDVAGLAYAKATYERNQALLAKQAVSQDAVDSLKSLYDQAEAQVALDQANISLRAAELKAANVNLDYTNIRSPVDGTVVSRNVEMGQTVAASFQTPTLFLIATDLTKMQVDTNVSESDVGALKIDDKVDFTVESFAQRRFEGTMVQIRQAPQTIQNVVTFDAVVGAPNPDLLLKPGMTATVRLVTDRRDNVLRVSSQAIRYVPSGGGVSASTGVSGGARIFVLRDGQPLPLTVETGLDDDSYVEITKGDLRPGDEVVSSEQVATALAVPPNQQAAPKAPRL
jgi:HlyD family secretion protein